MKPLMLLLFFSVTFSCWGGTKLVLKGSDTLGAKMVPQLAEGYRKLNPSVTFEIEAEGSSSCFKALLNGKCDLGMSSRPVTETELNQFKAAGLTLREHVVAHDMIAVIVNAKNRVKNLTLAEVEQVFTGDIVDWGAFGGRGRVVTITRNSSSGTYKSFQKMAMNGRPYGKRTQRLAGADSLPAEVSQDVRAISYCGLAYAQKKGVRPLAVDGVAPTAVNVRRYPISRDLFFYTVGDISPEVKRFIRWVRDSEEGREVVARVGFIPFQPNKKQAEDAGQPVPLPERKPADREKAEQ